MENAREFGVPCFFFFFAESEKGFSDQLFDSPRSFCYLSFLSEVIKSMWEDGVEVISMYAQVISDNWEFGDSASQFGLQVVNRTTQQVYYKRASSI